MFRMFKTTMHPAPFTQYTVEAQMDKNKNTKKVNKLVQEVGKC